LCGINTEQAQSAEIAQGPKAMTSQDHNTSQMHAASSRSGVALALEPGKSRNTKLALDGLVLSDYTPPVTVEMFWPTLGR
jgi:hypothetical protein